MTLTAVQWICSVGLVYAFIAAVYSKVNTLRTFFRRLWTVTLASGFTTALLAMHGYRMSLSWLTDAALITDRAVSTLVGFALVSLVVFGVCYPVATTSDLSP
jgi:hypothetical protein